MKLVIWPLVATALAVGSGCARPDWIEQTLVTVDVTGVWQGTISAPGSAGNNAAVELTLQQRGSKVTGQARGRLTSGNLPLSDGPIEGTISGDIFRFFTPRAGVTGELQVNGDEMTGSATTQYGPGVTIQLRRQQ